MISVIILAAVLAYHFHNATPSGDAPPPRGQAQTATTPATAGSDAPAAEAPGANRFDFYTLLPEMEVKVSDEELRQALDALPRARRQGPYILQVGSFHRIKEADALKARLALIGIESSIQTVIINERESWHRVRIGPYDSLAALKPVRRRLKRNDINFMLLRIAKADAAQSSR